MLEVQRMVFPYFSSRMLWGKNSSCGSACSIILPTGLAHIASNERELKNLHSVINFWEVKRVQLSNLDITHTWSVASKKKRSCSTTACTTSINLYPNSTYFCYLSLLTKSGNHPGGAPSELLLVLHTSFNCTYGSLIILSAQNFFPVYNGLKCEVVELVNSLHTRVDATSSNANLKDD